MSAVLLCVDSRAEPLTRHTTIYAYLVRHVRDVVDRLKITQFYTSPTAIRALMKSGCKPVEPYDLSSLRILGSVGEPINPEVR